MNARQPHSVRKIISGGQTGVDRGALDAAIQLGIEHGGWCPRGRLAEDGPIPHRYRLAETDSPKYPARTAQNVIDGEGTLILFDGALQGGTELTVQMARRYHKPHLLVDLAAPPPIDEPRQWLKTHAIHVLNVAGPRESSSPGIARKALEYLVVLLGERP